MFTFILDTENGENLSNQKTMWAGRKLKQNYILYYILYYRGWIISILNKKGMEYLFYRSGKIKANKTQQISVKTKVFL